MGSGKGSGGRVRPSLFLSHPRDVSLRYIVAVPETDELPVPNADRVFPVPAYWLPETTTTLRALLTVTAPVTGTTQLLVVELKTAAVSPEVFSSTTNHPVPVAVQAVTASPTAAHPAGVSPPMGVPVGEVILSPKRLVVRPLVVETENVSR